MELNNPIGEKHSIDPKAFRFSRGPRQIKLWLSLIDMNLERYKMGQENEF